MTRYTVQVRPSMHKIGPGAGSGTKQETPQGYEVEFYKAGEFVQFRVYAYTDELLMATRITEWVRDGKLVVSA